MNDINQRHNVALPTPPRRVHVFGSRLEDEPAYGIVEPTATTPKLTARAGFAIPTTHLDCPIAVGDLRWYVGELLADARSNPEITLVVHANTFAEIAPADVLAEMFANAPDNVELPAGWRKAAA